ncbi:MAG: HEAT repeat domain-containing protein, partial [Planctomycetota bacterium]|nr:HEAT repeat domain-containing protein [Planctomycetota bacterium]
MNKLTLSGFACAAMLALPATTLAHGGKYRGPGDVVPPNAGGGPTTGGPGAPGPVTPGPNAPGAPPPAGPTTPGSAPGGPATGGPAAGPAVGPKTGPRGIQIGADLSKWQFWWEFNKDPFINLKDAIHAPSTTTGSDEFFMGSTRRVASKDTAKPSESDIQETILPALKRALDTTDDRDINSSCMIALAKIGRDHSEFEILPIFKALLKKPDQEIRETAALSMGISGMANSKAMLIDLASDSPVGRKACGRSQVDGRTRSFACYGLGLIAHLNDKVDLKRECFEALDKILADKNIRDRNLKVAAINGMALLNLKKDNLSDKETLLLDATLKSLDTYYDKSAGRGTDLIKSHVPPAIAKLIGRGNSDRHNTYKEKFSKELSSRKKKGNDIYRAAALALGQLAQSKEANKLDEKYSKTLFKYYQNGKDLQAKFFCLLALGQIGGDGNKNVLLTELRKGRKALDRPWAALALGVMNFYRFANDSHATIDNLVGDRLVKQIKEVKTPEARAAFAVALGLCRYSEGSSELMDLLMKYRSQDEFAGYLCVGLALMNEQKAKEDIHDVVRKSVRRPDLLKQAAIALGKLGDKTVTQTLTGMLQEKETNLAKLSAIASALSFIGDRRTIQPLKKMLF